MYNHMSAHRDCKLLAKRLQQRYLKSRKRHFFEYTVPHVYFKITHVDKVNTKIPHNNNNAQLEMLFLSLINSYLLYFQYFSQKTAAAALDVSEKMKC